MAEENTTPPRSAWAILLDKIAFGILNWKSTLEGLLDVYLIIFAVITSAQLVEPSGGKSAKYFLASGLVAKQIVAWLRKDDPKSTSSSFLVAGTTSTPVEPESPPSAETAGIASGSGSVLQPAPTTARKGV